MPPQPPVRAYNKQRHTVLEATLPEAVCMHAFCHEARCPLNNQLAHPLCTHLQLIHINLAELDAAVLVAQLLKHWRDHLARAAPLQDVNTTQTGLDVRQHSAAWAGNGQRCSGGQLQAVLCCVMVGSMHSRQLLYMLLLRRTQALCKHNAARRIHTPRRRSPPPALRELQRLLP